MTEQQDTRDEAEVRGILDGWVRATREGRQDDILAHHAEGVVLYDVLPPLRYTSAADYRAGWGDWQPEVQGEMLFELEELVVHVGRDVGFAFGMLQCGGRLPDGRTFRDTARATFCFTRTDAGWRIVHQHISMPKA